MENGVSEPSTRLPKEPIMNARDIVNESVVACAAAALSCAVVASPLACTGTADESADSDEESLRRHRDSGVDTGGGSDAASDTSTTDAGAPTPDASPTP